MASATAMVSLWRKYKNASKRKKQTLHSLFVGFVLFCLLYVISRVVAFPICPIKHFFGVSCPGCGLTRGFLAVLKFDFRAATEYHLLSVPLFIGVLFYAGGAISDIFSTNSQSRIQCFLNL